MSKKKIKAQHVSIPVHNVPQQLDSMNDKWWYILIALAITFLCFYSSVKNGFVNWDDDLSNNKSYEKREKISRAIGQKIGEAEEAREKDA